MSRARKVHKTRYCAFCDAPLVETRPVFLVGDTNGNILGPFHAGCAARLALAHKGKPNPIELPGRAYGNIIAAQLPLPSIRRAEDANMGPAFLDEDGKDTLPW